MGRLVFAVPLKMRRAEALRPARRSPRSLSPRLAAGDAPTGAQPATFDLGSGPYGWHGTGRITSRSIAGAARRDPAVGALHYFPFGPLGSTVSGRQRKDIDFVVTFILAYQTLPYYQQRASRPPHSRGQLASTPMGAPQMSRDVTTARRFSRCRSESNRTPTGTRLPPG